MTRYIRLSTLAALAAGVSLVATPVAALDLPDAARAEIYTGVADQAGWDRGRRHRRGVDAGDVIAGVLVIGAIAAIAGAANGRSRYDDRRRETRYPDPDYRADPRTPMRGDYQSSRGIDSAVSMCVDQVERGNDRVERVDNASRTADGWRISGSLEDGAGWNCWIDNDGRIRELDLAGDVGDYDAGSAAGRQLSDEQYASARAAQRGSPGPAVAPSAYPADGPQPAYPGGPLPGEEGYDEAVRLRSNG